MFSNSPNPDFAPSKNTDKWPIVCLGNKSYKVSPIPWAPIAIGDALEAAAAYGGHLPSKELVDAIYVRADVVISPALQSHDGTAKTMSSEKMYKKVSQDIWTKINVCVFDLENTLIVGTHKDIILTSDGVLALYGWKMLNDENIQNVFTKHIHEWCDYSQGVRIVIPI